MMEDLFWKTPPASSLGTAVALQLAGKDTRVSALVAVETFSDLRTICGDANTNPRKVESFLFDNVIPSHTSDFEVMGNPSFAWDGNLTSVVTSGVMFEMKIGNFSFYPPDEADAVVPEPTTFLLGVFSMHFLITRRSLDSLGILPAFKLWE